MDNGDYHVVDKGDWFKIHHTGWLEGSLRYNKDYDGDKLAAFRGVMTDICALISRSRFRDGTLRYAVGKPMQRDYIAKVLNISLGLLNEFVDLGLKDTNNDNDHTRIEIWEDGTIEVVNWQRHQAVKTKKQNASSKYNSFPREPVSHTIQDAKDKKKAAVFTVTQEQTVIDQLAEKGKRVFDSNGEIIKTSKELQEESNSDNS